MVPSESALASRHILPHVWDPTNTLHHRIIELALPSQCDSRLPGYRSRPNRVRNRGAVGSDRWGSAWRLGLGFFFFQD